MINSILEQRNKVKLKNGRIGYLVDTGNDFHTTWGICDDYNKVIIEAGNNYITEKDIDEVIEYFDWDTKLEKYEKY